MPTFRQVIDLWPSLEALADDAGANVVAVRKWRQRDSIPAEFWAAIVIAAPNRQIKDVTLELLASIAAKPGTRIIPSGGPPFPLAVASGLGE